MVGVSLSVCFMDSSWQRSYPITRQMSLDTNRHPVQEWDSFSPDKNCCRRQREWREWREGGREGETNRKREVLKSVEGGSPLDRLTASSAAAVIDISIFNWLSSAKLEGGGKGEERCRRDH